MNYELLIMNILVTLHQILDFYKNFYGKRIERTDKKSR